LKWTLDAISEDRTITADARALCCVRQTDRTELASCYTTG
jgi:hypothetical protein